MCREEAQGLASKRDDFAALGVKLVAVVHEANGVDKFRPYFGGEGNIFLDSDRSLMKALWLGKGDGYLGIIGMVLPSVIRNARRAKAKKGLKGNMEGEGRHLGGLLVMKAGDGGVVFQHNEAVFGDHADLADVLAAAKVSTSSSESTQDSKL